MPAAQPLASFLSRQRLAALLDGFPALHIAVIGDIALDAYWHVDMTRSHLSRETPHFPRPVVRERYAPGAGGNVAANLKAAGVGQVRVYSVLGEDHWARELRSALEGAGVEHATAIASTARRTTAYIKPILMGYNVQQEDARLDFENTQALAQVDEDRLLTSLERDLPELEAVIIADQLDLCGVITDRVRARLNQLAAAHPGRHFLVDSRQHIAQFHGMVLKPNWLEASAALHPGEAAPREIDLAALREAGRTMSQAGGRPVVITLSEQGALACTPERQEHIPPPAVRPPLDVTGAGDAFMAALAASLAAGASAWEAAALANLAAAVTVEKLDQTGTATPGEILARYDLAQENPTH